MCVLQDSAAHAIITYDRADSSKCYVQPSWFRKPWREETKLYLACAAWLSSERQRQPLPAYI